MPEPPETPGVPAKRRWIIPILVLPVNGVILIPAVVLWLSGYQWRANAPLLTVLGAALLCAGLGVAVWTMRLFHTLGQGTAAPWEPPKKLVVAGPYCYVRNPMLSSVFVMLAAEALLLNSWAVFAWLAVFFALNMAYFPLVEEKGLERRFGDDYRNYKRHVPRLVPRLTPWRGEPEQ
ncbi:MAG: isoprenylcysteine carboxylmethyltransferase family protein [Candidatus Adiutrix sp.]|jgi:protein-S-isoprenylcysteine O-methyltransferase Ste14|nr:isoprenylcysteine carboxylmethyltransferase family protein [Candidatus Adiutrix sp.]